MLSTSNDSEMDPDSFEEFDLLSPHSAELVNIDPSETYSLFPDVLLPLPGEYTPTQFLPSLPVATGNRIRSVSSSVSDQLQDLEETGSIDVKLLCIEQQFEQEQTPLTPSQPIKRDVAEMMFQQPLCSPLPPLECGNGRQFHSSASMNLAPMRFDCLPHHNYNYADTVGRHQQALHPQHLLLQQQQQQQQQQIFDCRTLQSSAAQNCQQSSLRTPTEWGTLFKMSSGEQNIFQYPTISTPASVCVAPDSTGCSAVNDEKPFSSYTRQQQHSHQQQQEEQQRSAAGRKRSHSAAVTSSSARQSAQADMTSSTGVTKKVGSRGRRAVNPSDCERVGASKVEQRQDRRRLSNRKAATKYREKQRKEIEGVRLENDRLVAENQTLKEQIAALNKELAEVKGEKMQMFSSQQQLQSPCLRVASGSAHWRNHV